ncbi:MAG: archease [Candidatus Altiarchaeales archaeon]|nr:archease [Candidatus Altiarchaeales archaeon]
MEKEFEFLEHTADLKFRSFGSTLNEAFENAGKAVFNAMADLNAVKLADSRKITLEAEDLEVLLHDFLSELIYLFSVEELLLKKFEVRIVQVDTFQLHATVSGEKIDLKRHKLHKEVKAATYHDMKIEKKGGEWIIEVVCDT